LLKLLATTMRSNSTWTHAMFLPVRHFGDSSISTCMRRFPTLFSYRSIFLTFNGIPLILLATKTSVRLLKMPPTGTQHSQHDSSQTQAILQAITSSTKTIHQCSPGTKKVTSGIPVF
jgi:hypothetical protein